MPFKPNTQVGFTPNVPFDVLARPEPGPTLGEEVGAAFQQENDVVNIYNLMTREKRPPDPNYDLLADINKNPWIMERQLEGLFVDVHNAQDFAETVGRIQKEDKEKEILSRAGWSGMAWMVAAGMLSPTSFLPLVGAGARGWQAFRQGAMLTALGAGVQETALYGAQESRDYSQIAFSIGASAALGGLLGGAVGLARARRISGQARIDALVQKLDHDLNEGAIVRDVTDQNLAIRRSEVGAARADEAGFEWRVPQGIAGIGGSTVKFGTQLFERMGPVTRSLSHPWEHVRMLMGQLDDAGLRMTDANVGRAVAPDGLISARISAWARNKAEGMKAIDKGYRDYVYDDKAPRYWRDMRASIEGLRRRDKLNRSEFNREVSLALEKGDQYQGNKYAQWTAQQLRQWIFDPMLKEAQKIGLIPEELKETADAGYLFRMYNRQAIKADSQGFLRVLTDHFETKMADDFKERLEKLKVAEADDEDTIAVLQLDDAEAAAQMEALAAELENLRQAPEQATALEIDDLLAQARDKKRTSPADYERLLKEARTVEEGAGPGYQTLRTREKEVRKRLRKLNQTRLALDKKRAQKLANVDRLEELQTITMDRVITANRTLLKNLDKYSDEVLDEKIDRYIERLEYAQRQYARYEDKIRKELAKDDGDLGKIIGWNEARDNHSDRFDEIADRLQAVRGIDRAAVEDELRGNFTDLFGRAKELNNRRALRLAELRKQIEAIKPDDVAARVSGVRERMEARRSNLSAYLHERGIRDISLENELANVHDAARRSAETFMNKVLGTHTRVPGLDILSEERGPELARMLDIPSERLEQFVERDAERIFHAYVRTMAPDIELHRRFGSVNINQYLGTNPENPGVLLEERNRRAATAPTAEEKARRLAQAKKAGASKEEIRAIQEQPDQAQIFKEYDTALRDITAVVQRLRHTYGLPTEPEAIATRLAKQAMNLNTLRFMGMVAVSSIPDVARFTMKHGPVAVFRDGLIPLIRGFRELRLSAQEAQLAGEALDVFLHTRMYEMMDLTEDFNGLSRVERGLNYATSKIGIIGLFDYWNAGMKQFAGVLTNAHILRSIENVVEGGGKSQDAIRYLAGLNIDGATAEDIWRLVKNGGGGRTPGGAWLPNTEDWIPTAERMAREAYPNYRPRAGGRPITEEEFVAQNVARAEKAVRVYRAALVREINATIVTPGVERPLIMDKNLPWKMVMQFKSFGVSSTYKTLMAGLQESPRNFAIGTAQALAFGALSYYLYKVAQGKGDEALAEDWDVWADEMIDRSGMLGVLGFGRDVASSVPWLNDYVMLSGQQTERRGGTGLANAIAGPTGDLLMTGTNAVAGMGDPTGGTVGAFRRMLPYQNIWWLRGTVFDPLENATRRSLDLPEKE